VVEIAATDVRLRGAIAQCPLVDGLAGTKNVPLTRLLRLLSLGSLDKLGSLVGRPPIYITASAAAGEFGAIAGEDAIAGLSLITPPKGTDWHNRVAARSLLGIGAHRPVRKAANIRCPILMIVADTDTTAPIGPALRVADRAPKSQLYRSRGGHYGPYKGGEDHDNVLRVEVEFLHRHAPCPRTFHGTMAR
jgi:pimeloyl-ACP methyl ester carboxylesterase